MSGNTRETANQPTWPDEAATLVDGPFDGSHRGLEWDEDEGQTLRFRQSIPDDARSVRRVGVVSFLPPREPAVAEPHVAEPYPSEPFAERTERTARPRLGTKTWAGLAGAMLGVSVVLLGWAVVIARSRHASIVSVAAAAPSVPAPAARGEPSMPAVIEAVDAIPVRATATAGVVRRAAARGAALRAGEALVELRRPNPIAAQKLAVLNDLADEYEDDDAADHADEIAHARADYEKAARLPDEVVVVRAPSDGVVVGSPPRPGTRVVIGDELGRMAASVRLILGAGDVDGRGTICRVVLLDHPAGHPAALLDGRLLPGIPEARSRTIALSRLPADLPLGTVGRVRAICP
jgi:hypothetical protein